MAYKLVEGGYKMTPSEPQILVNTSMGWVLVGALMVTMQGFLIGLCSAMARNYPHAMQRSQLLHMYYHKACIKILNLI